VGCRRSERPLGGGRTPTDCARRGREAATRGARRARRRARHPTRADEGRGDEARPGPVDRRLRPRARRRARGFQAAPSPPCADQAPQVPFARCARSRQRSRRHAGGAFARSPRRPSLPLRLGRCTRALQRWPRVAVKVQCPASPRPSRRHRTNAACCCRSSRSRPTRRPAIMNSCASGSRGADYELEAQSHRGFARVSAPPVRRRPRGRHVAVDAARAHHRVRRGRPFGEVRALPEEQRDRFARDLVRSATGCSSRAHRRRDPPPGTTCSRRRAGLLLDFGLVRRIDRLSRGERPWRARLRGTPTGPSGLASSVPAVAGGLRAGLGPRHRRLGRWYFQTGPTQSPDYSEGMEGSGSPRSPYF